MEYLFVMIISVTEIDEWKYVGNFTNCKVAQLYVSLHHPDTKATRCLLQDYIKLPEGTVIKSIDMTNNTIRYRDTHKPCKMTRSCNIDA